MNLASMLMITLLSVVTTYCNYDSANCCVVLQNAATQIMLSCS